MSTSHNEADANGRAYLHAPTIDEKLFIINEGILTITDQLEVYADLLTMQTLRITTLNDMLENLLKQGEEHG